ncbi:MAG: proline--tRNA ligase [Chloroflexi bacterium]|nr:proline--tRNA ligase [Chloroflexota bacterium]
MRQSTLFGRTLRDAPADAQTPGHKLMLRAAIARPLAAGIYTWLPIGFRVAKKVEQIIREEMNGIGAQEMELPVITPAEYWKETGRWDTLEPVAFRIKDHSGHDFMVSYTHEELVMHHGRSELLSYRQLPVAVYHFQSKGRDEARPRAGLLRVREFVMKDGYSFDADLAGLDKTYWAHHGAYARAFARMGLDALSVESDTGNMGGDVAHEFQVLTDVGEDRIVLCPGCRYSANMEKAVRRAAAGAASTAPAMEPVSTPGASSIEDLVRTLGIEAGGLLKTMLIRAAGGEVVAVVLPGDRELNEAKLRKLVGGGELAFANEADFAKVRGIAGFVGPVGLGARIVVDVSVAERGYVAGANRKDTHTRNVVPGRDFAGERADVHDVKPGDECPSCGKPLEIRRGVEVGNIFKFGPYYADKMGATFLAEDGTRKPFMFASYGIGVSRAVQTIIETNFDDAGIVWPAAVAPFDVHVVAMPVKDAEVRTAAETLVADLEGRGVEVLYDDRDESAGVKFADADLIGCPLRVTVSKRNVGAGKVEVRRRKSGEVLMLDAAAAAAELALLAKPS